MGTFLVYILKSAVCLAMFYLFYRLLLSKETFHRFNRMALLGVMLLSCLLPLVKVTVEQASPVNAQVMSMEDLLLMYQWNSEAVVVEEGSRPFHWQEGLVLVYFAGLFFVIARHLWSLGRMLYLIRHSRCERLDNGICLVVHHRKLAPFSWMRYIVISETDLKESGYHILVHEMAHIHHRHSWDLLLTEVCAWLQWFNPAIWLLKQELQNIHEYEADEEVLRQGINAKEYQMLLIKKAVGTRYGNACYASDTTFRPAMKSRTTVAMMIDFGSRLAAPWLIMPISTSLSVSHTACSPPRVMKSTAPTVITNSVQRRASRLLRSGSWCMTRRLNPLSAISRLFSAKKSFRSLSLSISVITVSC